jgi:hypothetical protein
MPAGGFMNVNIALWYSHPAKVIAAFFAPTGPFRVRQFKPIAIRAVQPDRVLVTTVRFNSLN